ncbi:hypothetical protein GQ53DRAFT_746562 [Thozetella sp. PMI_491]|nr:hypothetical protein GQ53DRAFT_746562 [Thozetella sp. PMI_491]
MAHITTEIEISAAPGDVRDKFLDFSKIPTYSPRGFFKSLGPAIKGKPLEVGDKMHNVLDGAVIEPVVIENSPTCFTWRGSMFGLKADHIFRFEPSTKTQGGTRFVHEETFSGPVAFLMGEGFAARSVGLKEKTVKGFETYNKDLKTWCETEVPL